MRREFRCVVQLHGIGNGIEDTIVSVLFDDFVEVMEQVRWSLAIEEKMTEDGDRFAVAATVELQVRESGESWDVLGRFQPGNLGTARRAPESNPTEEEASCPRSR